MNDVGLTGANRVRWRITDAPDCIEAMDVVSGPDPAGMGLQVALARWTCPTDPSRETLRTLHHDRQGKRLFPLVIAVLRGEKAFLLGPSSDAAVIVLPADQATRALQAALDEPDGLAARNRLASLQRATASTSTAGVTNEGLFAGHYLATSAPQRPDWAAARDAAKPMLNLRHETLVRALGYTTKRTAGHALLLSADTAPRAVAVLLESDEQFDASTQRFHLSPVAWGLRVAAKAEVPWLMVLRGSQIRLYPAKPGVGVGQKGQSDTWFELDLAVVDDEEAALLPLVFSSEALAPEGSTQQLLDGSAQFAVELGERLRDRVYDRAIPRLAAAVAAQLPAIGQSVDAAGLDLAYRLSLKILFRLLFQAYAEDRGLLPYGRNARYDRNALNTWAADLTNDPEQPFDHDSSAIWDDLAQVWRVIDSGDSAWNVPAYNGGLFGSDPQLHPEGALLARMRLGNDTVGPVLSAVLVDDLGDGSPGAVDFRSLSVREFGTIYEGLLESSLSLAPSDLTLDKSGTYLPAQADDDVVVAAGDVYFHSASGQRKSTGTYFTPHIVVEHLLDRALEPVLADHLAKVLNLLKGGDEAGAAEVFFDFRVADLAMGSAHFLTAAIDRIEAGMRNFLTEHPIPAVNDELRRLEQAAKIALGEDAAVAEIEPAALLRRQIARRCIYGLDLNPMAVELARLAIWITTFVPGLPMSSLDHTLVQANSLTGVGTIDEALEALDPESGTGTISFFADAIHHELAKARDLLVDAANASEATKSEATAAAHVAQEAKKAAEPARLLFDAVVAARLGRLTPAAYPDPADMQALVSGPEIVQEVEELQPAHFPYLFPEVFLRESPGFDVLVGNPPWDKVRWEAAPFWASVEPGLMAMSDDDRTVAIQRLRLEHPVEAAAEQREIVERSRLQELLRGGFALRGGTHLEVAQLMLERCIRLRSARGRIGVVLPRQSMVLRGWTPLRKHLCDTSSLDVLQVRNKGHEIFPSVHASYMAALVAIAPRKGVVHPNTPIVEVQAAAARAELLLAMRQRGVLLTSEDMLTMSESVVIPWFNSPGDRDVFDKMRRQPRLGGTNGWVTARQWTPWSFNGNGPHAGMRSSVGPWAILMARHVQALRVLADIPFNHFVSDDELWRRAPELVESNEAGELVLSPSHPVIVFRYPSRSDDTRTLISAPLPARGFLPNTAYVHGLVLENAPSEKVVLALAGLLSTFVLDWWARRFVDRHVTAPVIFNLPLPKWDEAQVQAASESTASILRLNGFEKIAGGIDLAGHSPSLDPVGDMAALERLAAAGFELTEADLARMLKDFTPRGVSDPLASALGLERETA